MQPKITIVSMDALAAAKMRKDILVSKVKELATDTEEETVEPKDK
jgi:hypothetical protein